MKIRSNRGMTGIEFGERRDLGWMSNGEITRSINFSNVDVTWIFNWCGWFWLGQTCHNIGHISILVYTVCHIGLFRQWVNGKDQINCKLKITRIKLTLTTKCRNQNSVFAKKEKKRKLDLNFHIFTIYID